jgi:hypothetical protein
MRAARNFSHPDVDKQAQRRGSLMLGSALGRVSMVVFVVSVNSVAWGADSIAVEPVAACLRGVEAAAGADLGMQLSVVAKDCAGAAAGLAELAATEPSRKASAFVSRACGSAAARLLSSSARDRWKKISSACGVPKPPVALASLEWVVYAKINAWLSARASDPNLVVRAAAANAIATSKERGRSLHLPIAARWDDRHALAGAESRFTDEVSSRNYVLVSDTRTFAGRWPTVELDQRGPIAPSFPEIEVATGELRGRLQTFGTNDPCPSTVLIADGHTKATRLGEVARALSGCEVRIAVAVGDTLAVHQVRLRAGQAQAAEDPEIPAWLSAKKTDRIGLHGSVADVVRQLDQLAARSIPVAQLD